MINYEFSLGDWIESVSNHFWWSLCASNGNAEEFAERFQSIVFHVINKHTWPGNHYFKKCAHEKIPKDAQREKKWMVPGSEAHNAFKNILLHANVKKDCLQMGGGVHTTLLEVRLV